MNVENEPVVGIYRNQNGKYVWVLGEHNGKYLCKSCESGISYEVSSDDFQKFVFLDHWENE